VGWRGPDVGRHAPPARLWASFTNAGAPAGWWLSTVVLTVTAAASGERAFLAWGWRVPFLLSILLLGIGLFIRLKVEETPVFARRAVRARPAVSTCCATTRGTCCSRGVGLARSSRRAR